jgi:hypothetical protein
MAEVTPVVGHVPFVIVTNNGMSDRMPYETFKHKILHMCYLKGLVLEDLYDADETDDLDLTQYWTDEEWRYVDSIPYGDMIYLSTGALAG